MNVIDEATLLEMLMIYRQNQAHVLILELYIEFEQLGNTYEVDESLLSDNPISFTISCTQLVFFYGGMIQFQSMNVIDEATLLEMLMIYRQNQAHVLILELYIEFEQLGNTYEVDESLLSDNPISFTISCTQNQAHVLILELYVEFEQLGNTYEVDESLLSEGENIDWEENNSDSEEEFLANNDILGGSDGGNESRPKREVHSIPFVQDGEFAVGMEFGSREAVLMKIRRYTLYKGVDYMVYRYEPLTFYARCLQYGRGCDWLLRASLIEQKCCREIRQYNGSHTCTIGMISQDHSKLDPDTIVDAIRPQVEVDPSLKVRLIIVDVQSKFNYTISYRKAWLAKQKSIAKIFGG
ncbi:hypothetical protein Ahy_B08g090350 [Arachis hypogaea]|uniref:Transposase MuDR plant domain-containing protein n=1 Tax=Arachis hypogaea TaxID=3818 RepID=A0A444Y066_ARAHY|nr:hypothetical protein Ahy_B08g090350 [Arachis hypogaea]